MSRFLTSHAAITIKYDSYKDIDQYLENVLKTVYEDFETPVKIGKDWICYGLVKFYTAYDATRLTRTASLLVKAPETLKALQEPDADIPKLLKALVQANKECIEPYNPTGDVLDLECKLEDRPTSSQEDEYEMDS